MIAIRTVKIPLNISPKVVKPTLEVYSNAFNHICQVGFAKSVYNKVDLHNLSYYESKELFNLPSQLIISVRQKAAEALKAQLKPKKKDYDEAPSVPVCPTAKNMSIRYDMRSFSILKNGNLSILLIDKRIETTLKIREKDLHYFKEWKRGEAELFIRKNKVFLNITFSKNLPDISPDGEIVGIDRGINNVAVSSNNKFYSGKKVKHISYRYRRQRQKLQKKNTKSAKRHLRSVRAKESRFKSDVNHCISKKIIADLKAGDTVVLEDLSKIRKNAKKYKKPLRGLVNSWSFYQLEQYLRYKAEIAGIRVITVNPAYTSQICSKCGYKHKDNRKGNLFACQECGFRIHADLNAARNIKLKHLARQERARSAALNQPNGANEVCSNVSMENNNSPSGTSPFQACLGEGN